MSLRVEDINIEILQQCRIQAGLDLDEVKGRVAKIIDIENGDSKPTLKQLDTLSSLYNVPRWVFISETLPEEYQFDVAVPAFRQFSKDNADLFGSSKVRNVTTRVERFREFLLDLFEDIGEEVPLFNPPVFREEIDPEEGAELIRTWLNLPTDPLDFSEWKTILEKNGVFVFMTSKYKGWSHLEKSLIRGLTIYHETLPIIIINDSDAKKARSFTLVHELGHLLRKESTIDNWEYHSRQIESWCDQLAGNVLMPDWSFREYLTQLEDLASVKRIAKNLKVSPYACLVRLRQLSIIDQDTYSDFEEQLKAEYTEVQRRLRQSTGGPSRNRPKEVLNQYGHLYTNAVFQAYHNNEIGLHKLTKIFDLKKTSYVFEIEASL